MLRELHYSRRPSSVGMVVLELFQVLEMVPWNNDFQDMTSAMSRDTPGMSLFHETVYVLDGSPASIAGFGDGRLE